MAEKQTKGFYRDIEAGETFKVGQEPEQKAPADESKLMGKGEGFVMNIGFDKKKEERIFLKKMGGQGQLTGNPIFDAYTKLNEYLIEHGKIKVTEIAVIFRLMATMINAGIPLIKSLNTLGVQSDKNLKLRKVLFDLAHEVEGGSTLSKAMGKYPDVFPEAQIGSIQAGEASGQLNKTFRNLAEEAEKSASIAGKVKGALMYPMVILVVLTVIIILMMTLVIPQLSGLFQQAGADLPLPTKVLMVMSDFTINYWWILLMAAGGLIFGVITWKKTKSGKYYWDYMLIKLPVFGPLVIKSTLAKFAYSFGNLLGSGVPIIKSMEIVSMAIGNEVYRRRFMLTAEDMKSGIPMAENLSNSKLFPSMLVNMIEVGEQTAQLEMVTQKVAEFYNEEVSTAVSSLTKIMEPMIMVIVGVVVGGLVAAIMLPIMQLTSLTGKL
jgi:type IV pilus assembly protein PilC